MYLAFVLAALGGGAAAPAPAGIVSGVRTALGRQDFNGAETILRAYRAERGVTPEWLEAFSWLGRAALAARSLDRADTWAEEAQQLALEALRGRALDAEPHLPVALGAAIEVHAQVLAARGQRAAAVAGLEEQLARYGSTSIRTRIQKNINLLSLEGKAAPPLELEGWIGSRPVPLKALHGKPVLLFFCAHWCGDCKADVPEIVKLKERFAELVLVAPTQWYGYVAAGREAAHEEETAYITQVWKKFYAPLGDSAVPLGAGNFRNYGASTTPTVVLLDRLGIVRMYHPGAMTYPDLATRVEAVYGK